MSVYEELVVKAPRRGETLEVEVMPGLTVRINPIYEGRSVIGFRAVAPEADLNGDGITRALALERVVDAFLDQSLAAPDAPADSEGDVVEKIEAYSLQ